MSDLRGTLRASFGIGRATISAASLTDARTLTAPDKSGTLVVADDLAAYTPNDVTVTVTATSGASAPWKRRMNIDPSSPSTLQADGYEVRTVYNSGGGNQPVNPGGWVGAVKANVEFSNNSVVDKSVTNSAFATLVGNSQVDKLLLYEGIINFMGSTANINQACVFYVPNMSVVPNIERIATFYSFGCDYANAHMKNVGRYLKAMKTDTGSVLREVASAPHPGLRSGRTYGPASNDPSVARIDNTAIGGVLYAVPIFVPHRCTVSAVGVRLNTAVTSQNLKLAIYHSNNAGKLGLKIYESGNISLGTSGDKQVTGLSLTLEAGMHFLCVLTSADASLKWSSCKALLDMFGRNGPEGTDSLPVYGTGYIALPADMSSVDPTYIGTSGFVPDVYWHAT
ncbi:hypothetical protein NDO41_16310 [Ectopseudomonas mendocina]|nr:hypothetical protein NDO41_16310 [Pseudomonas mendocina]